MRKLMVGLALMSMALGVMPAQADKATNSGVVECFSNVKAKGPGGPKEKDAKKGCPWAVLKQFPCKAVEKCEVQRLGGGVWRISPNDPVGGTFLHISQAKDGVRYDEIDCEHGSANGSIKLTDKDSGASEHYDIIYVRAGATAVIVGDGKTKNDAFVGLLVFHVKKDLVQFATQCQSHTKKEDIDDFKVQFDVLADYVNATV